MRLSVSQAALLGAVHGPAELLPISSSAHIELLPVLLGWDHSGMSAPERKAFEVALHAGSLVGLVRVTDLPGPGFALAATAPAAITGLLLEDVIERRLGGPRATAAGLACGSLILVGCDSLAQAGERSHGQLTEALVIGAAQALALVPGLSRLGMTASAARLLGHTRSDAFALGRSAGLPVLAAATVLKTARVSRSGLPGDLRKPFLAGVVAAAASSLAAAPLARKTPVKAAAAWRCGLAIAALRHNARR